MGDTGPTGNRGDTGPTGNTGHTGDIGPTGYTGPTGAISIQVGGTGAVLVTDPSNVYSVAYNNTITIDNSYNEADAVNSVVVNVSGSILPTLSNTFSLGSTGAHWKEIYVGPGSLNIQGPGGAFATIGSDSQGIAYAESGFAVPFINVGPSQLNPQATGGWKIGPTGTQGGTEYDLVATEVDPDTGLVTGPNYSLIRGTTGATGHIGLTGVTGATGHIGLTGVTGATGHIGLTGVTGVTGVTGPAGQFAGTFTQGSTVNLSGNVDNLSLLSGTNSVYRITSNAPYSVYGLQGGTVGRYVVIVNDSGHTITFHNEQSSSTNINRFYMTGASNSTIAVSNHGSITLMYVSGLSAGTDTDTSRWVVVSAMT